MNKQMRKLTKLKQRLIESDFEFYTKKDELLIERDNLIAKIWYEEEHKEFFILTFSDAKAVLVDDYTKTYYKKKAKGVIKVLNKLVAS